MLEHEGSEIQKFENHFFKAAPELLKQADIFGENPTIVRIGGKDLTISTLDSNKNLVRNAHFMKAGTGFDLLDVEQIKNPLEDGVLKPGVLCPAQQMK